MQELLPSNRVHTLGWETERLLRRLLQCLCGGDLFVRFAPPPLLQQSQEDGEPGVQRGAGVQQKEEEREGELLL